MVPECFGLEGEGMSLRDALKHLKHIEPDPEAEQRRKGCLEQVQDVRSRLRVAPNSVTDREILGCIDCLFHEVYRTTPFEEDYDQLIGALSFSTQIVRAADRRLAWSDFLQSNNLYFDYPVTEAVALWFRDRNMLNHACSVYEDLHREARTNPAVGKGYLLDMMEVYAQLGEFERVRDLFAIVKDARYANEVSEEFLDQALEYVIQSSESKQDLVDVLPELLTAYSQVRNDLSNAKLEIDHLKTGVRFPEERRAAIEWLETHHRMLLDKLMPEAKETLVEAVMYAQSSSLWRENPIIVPILCQKVVEIEFEAKVWRHIKTQLGASLSGRMAAEQTINQIHEILTGSGRDEVREANKAAYPIIDGVLGGKGIFSQEHHTKLLKLKVHSTDARHGKIGRKYTIERLGEFLNEIEIDKLDGWIFKFLGKLQPKG